MGNTGLPSSPVFVGFQWLSPFPWNFRHPGADGQQTARGVQLGAALLLPTVRRVQPDRESPRPRGTCEVARPPAGDPAACRSRLRWRGFLLPPSPERSSTARTDRVGCLHGRTQPSGVSLQAQTFRQPRKLAPVGPRPVRKPARWCRYSMAATSTLARTVGEVDLQSSRPATHVL
jgi:hypothetical protein